MQITYLNSEGIHKSEKLAKLLDELRNIRDNTAHGLLEDPNSLAARLSELGLSTTIAQLPDLISNIQKVFGHHVGYHPVPKLLVQLIEWLLERRTGGIICDPWAGVGTILDIAHNATTASKAFAFTQTDEEFALGRILVSAAEWQIGDPFQLLSSLQSEIDVVISIPPFGVKSTHPIVLTGMDGTQIELRDNLGSLILVAAANRLNSDGIGIFVIPPSFFYSQRSVFRHFSSLGLSVEAAVELPAGLFAPLTNISTYLIIVRRRAIDQMFVAKISNDLETNLQIFSNLKARDNGGTLELGCFVDPLSFKGLNSIRLAERIHLLEKQIGSSALRLKDFSTAINVGRPKDGFQFPPYENAIFIPLIGSSVVVDSVDDFTLKPQYYVQVVIDSKRSDARFVAKFLNSEFGREIMDLSKLGGIIPTLSRQILSDLHVFIPDLQIQEAVLDIENRLTAEQNTLLGIQNEFAELNRDLWSNFRDIRDVDQRLTALSTRFPGGLKQYAVERLDQWFETLPFPLASILRAWQATPSQDFKTKYEHLLHFFEGMAEFFSVIFLSAFSSNEVIFASHKQKLADTLQKQNLNFKRATFGTWKVVMEYLGKQTRLLLSGDADKRSLCAEIFSDASLVLPEALSRKELADILSATNKMRNDWGGHGGVVGKKEAQLRNEKLLGQVEKLREVMADAWIGTQLIHALHSELRRGVYANEVSLLMGSNSEFLKESRVMSLCLDTEMLYLSNKASTRALQLLPLVQVGPSPRSAMNACYFFNRLEREGARFVSYHFAEMPEITDRFDKAIETIGFLTKI